MKYKITLILSLVLCVILLQRGEAQVKGNASIYSNSRSQNAPVQMQNVNPVPILGGSRSQSLTNVYQNSYDWQPQQVQVPVPIVPNDKVLTFSVNALMNVTPDAYVAIFNVLQVGNTAVEADSLLARRVKNFTSSAIKAGVKQEDIYLDMLSLVPVFETEVEKKLFSKSSYVEVPKGFELQKNIHVKYTNPEILDKMISAAAQNEIYELVKVEYISNRSESIYDTLRERSVRLLNKKLASFEQVGVNLDTVYRVLGEKSRAYFPVERYQDYLSNQTFSVDAAKTRSGIKSSTQKTLSYYVQIPYNDFDIVINPTIVEPGIQYVYQVELKFIIEPEVRVQTQREFLHIDNQGNIKTLRID